MRYIYFTLNNGMYLSGINIKKTKWSDSYSEDDRLWFDEKEATLVVNFFNKISLCKVIKQADKPFVEMLENFRNKNIISVEEYQTCHRVMPSVY